MRRRVALSTLLPLTLVAALGSCGSSEPTAGDAQDRSTTTTGTATTGTATTPTAADDPASTDPVSTEDTGRTVTIKATYSDGRVSTPRERFEIELGQSVAVSVTSDVEEEVHIHGYDVSLPLSAGSPAEVTFIADIPGVFEVELEDSGTFLFEVLVR